MPVGAVGDGLVGGCLGLFDQRLEGGAKGGLLHGCVAAFACRLDVADATTEQRRQDLAVVCVPLRRIPVDGGHEGPFDHEGCIQRLQDLHVLVRDALGAVRDDEVAHLPDLQEHFGTDWLGPIAKDDIVHDIARVLHIFDGRVRRLQQDLDGVPSNGVGQSIEERFELLGCHGPAPVSVLDCALDAVEEVADGSLVELLLVPVLRAERSRPPSCRSTRWFVGCSDGPVAIVRLVWRLPDWDVAMALVWGQVSIDPGAGLGSPPVGGRVGGVDNELRALEPVEAMCYVRHGDVEDAFR